MGIYGEWIYNGGLADGEGRTGVHASVAVCPSVRPSVGRSVGRSVCVYAWVCVRMWVLVQVPVRVWVQARVHPAMLLS